jgi:ABC-2 type transport system permease protein
VSSNILNSNGKTFAMATWALTRREILRFLRQRSRLIGALGTPLMFWIVIGGGLQNSFINPDSGVKGGYSEFFYPGIIALSVLFTAIFSTMSVIEDRHQGFLQGVLVSPISRSVFPLSKILGGAALATLQGALLLVLAPVVGISLGVVQVIFILLLLFCLGAALTGLGFIFAWKIDSTQGYHGIMNLVLFPMWLLSGAIFPLAGAHPVFQWLGKINPLSYGVTSLRDLMITGALGWPYVFTLAILLASVGLWLTISRRLATF